MVIDSTPPAETRRQRFLDVCPLISPVFERYAHAEHMPSVVFGVVLDTDLIFTDALGARVIGHSRKPDKASVYRIASMTKSFTAAAVLSLRDAGRLRLDDAVSSWVPELEHLVYPNADSADLTIRDLLTMSAGWPQDDPWADRQLYRDHASMTALYREGVTFSNPPGITFEYSNYAYIVLGRIVTCVSGEPAMAYIERVLLKPLEMDSTWWQPDAIPDSKRAQGYRWEDEQWREEQPLASGGDVAAFAGLCSTIHDLARWIGFFLSAWPPRDGPDTAPLSRATRREMQQIGRAFTSGLESRRIGDPPEIFSGGYGFGLSCQHNGRWKRVGHGGGLPGFGSHMCWAPAHGVGVVALANVTYANVHDACGDALETLIDNAGIQPRKPLASTALRHAHEDLFRLLNCWNDDLAEQLFADNFFLDRDREHWQADLDALRKIHGTFIATGDINAGNWLRGERRLNAERGWCLVWATLSPTVPPRVQTLKIQSVLPPSAELLFVAERVIELTATPRRRELDRLLSSNCDRDIAWKQVQLVNLEIGACTLDDVISGKGGSCAEFSVTGGGRELTLTLHINRRGKLIEMSFLVD